MGKTSRVLVPLLLIWLLGWIILSWPAIQDDALIHLRYADHLARHGVISYDGVHPDYGASSILYVSLLAALRTISHAPDLARVVSSIVHVLIFLGLACGLRLAAGGAARRAGLLLLFITVMPAAVRWLDDGMETGLAVCVACTLAWCVHSGTTREKQSGLWQLGVSALAFFAVLLRSELLLLCFGAFFILVASDLSKRERATLRQMIGVGVRRSGVLIGAALAAAFIFGTMHTLLPDTAVAKSRGIASWYHSVHDAALTLGSALSFGAGLLSLWLLTMVLAASRRDGLTLRLAVANSFAPIVLVLAMLRGQEIQGVRYFAWTFFFSIVWNILELAADAQDSLRLQKSGSVALVTLGVLLILDLPFESVAMHRVLKRRAETTHTFEAQHLEVLNQQRGVASDVGHIGYFTQAQICDLAGLVNGRDRARMSSLERAQVCVRTAPDFIFLNLGQLVPVTRMIDLSRWKICGRYDFANLSTPDMHYLLVKPEIASLACSATGRVPEPIESILPSLNAGAR